MAPALTSTIYHEPSTLGNILTISPASDSKPSQLLVKNSSHPRPSTATLFRPQDANSIATSDSRALLLQPNYLQSSPYPNPLHLLNLNRLPPASLTAVRSDYATAPYDQVFNWDRVLHTLRSLSAAEGFHFPASSFYTVIFRSKLKADVDKELLFRLDAMSHQEAIASGGLLKYWFGSPDAERRNLATCEFTPFYFLFASLFSGRVSFLKSCGERAV